MFGALSSHEGLARLLRPLPRALGRWGRILYVALPCLLFLNYLVLFQWSWIEGRIPEGSARSWVPGPFGRPSNEQIPYGPLGEEVEDDGVDYWLWKTKTQFGKRDVKGNWNATKSDCAGFPLHLLNRIQVVLKVGAADDASRTEAQLSSVVKCIPNLLVVSDDDHAYGPYNALDVLKSLPPDTYLSASDYSVYDTQKNSSNSDLVEGHDGWKIDKYKFLPAVEAATEVAPDAQWYVFLESDTYIFWDNLFRLLENYNASLPWYMGSPSPGKEYRDKTAVGGKRKVWFANGGPGFVLSTAAAESLVARKRNTIGMMSIRVTDRYKKEIREDCCGDSILGWALHDKTDVHITGLWPMFNPHPLHTIPFGKKYWCEPVISLHKTSTEDFLRLWEFENGRDREKSPLLYHDLFTSLHHLGTFSNRTDWDAAYHDGYNHPSEHPAHASFETCAQACSEEDSCVQFTYHASHCWMSRSLYIGHAKDPDGHHDEEARKYTSGWDIAKIQKWMEEGGDCSEGAHWVRGSTTRIY